MRIAAAAAIGLSLLSLSPLTANTAAQAQTLNDVGRTLQEQVLGGRPNPDAERRAYEQGRRDQENSARQNEDYRRQSNDDRRRYDEDRRRQWEESQRRERDGDRQRADQQRAWADEQRARQNGRY